MPSGNRGKAPLILLHGFLGLPQDWRDFVQQFEKNSNHLEKHEPHLYDLWRDVRLSMASGESGFSNWLDGFHDALVRFRRPPVLVGYSLGGRLALQAAIQFPDLVKGVVAVSAHVGLAKETEREERLTADQLWAQRWRSESWSEVLEAWNQQSVFSFQPDQGGNQTQTLRRGEKDFVRSELAWVLDHWSLARQKNLRPDLRQLHIPALFVSGEWDKKFTELYQSLELPPAGEFRALSSAGHRVLADQPESLAKEVIQFIEKFGL